MNENGSVNANEGIYISGTGVFNAQYAVAGRESRQVESEPEIRQLEYSHTQIPPEFPNCKRLLLFRSAEGIRPSGVDYLGQTQYLQLYLERAPEPEYPGRY